VDRPLRSSDKTRSRWRSRRKDGMRGWCRGLQARSPGPPARSAGRRSPPKGQPVQQGGVPLRGRIVRLRISPRACRANPPRVAVIDGMTRSSAAIARPPARGSGMGPIADHAVPLSWTHRLRDLGLGLRSDAPALRRRGREHRHHPACVKRADQCTQCASAKPSAPSSSRSASSWKKRRARSGRCRASPLTGVPPGEPAHPAFPGT
jgi:hypothetical protein